jgi:hypothetical protein
LRKEGSVMCFHARLFLLQHFQQGFHIRVGDRRLAVLQLGADFLQPEYQKAGEHEHTLISP